LRELKGNNEFREKENKQLENDMGILEQHLTALESQNRELEGELQDIVHVDSNIRDRLRSRSP
jgi:chaperonin cofactor prefoldin